MIDKWALQFSFKLTCPHVNAHEPRPALYAVNSLNQSYALQAAYLESFGNQCWEIQTRFPSRVFENHQMDTFVGVSCIVSWSMYCVSGSAGHGRQGGKRALSFVGEALAFDEILQYQAICCRARGGVILKIIVHGWPLRNFHIKKFGLKFWCTPRYMSTITLCTHRARVEILA